MTEQKTGRVTVSDYILCNAAKITCSGHCPFGKLARSDKLTYDKALEAARNLETGGEVSIGKETNRGPRSFDVTCQGKALDPTLEQSGLDQNDVQHGQMIVVG
jgi:hypothetical protein